MRTALACAVLGFAISALAGAAGAQETFERWTSANGQLSFSRPVDWRTSEMRTSIAGAVRVVTGAADYECQIWSLPKENSAGASPEAVRQRYTRPMTEAQWRHIVEPLDYFREGLSIETITVDTNGAWPVQRVRLRSGEREIRGALQGQPGVELMSLCLSYDGADRGATFAAIESSVEAAPAPSQR